MCGIVRLLPGQMLPEEELFNLVWNNWHSWGIIIKNGHGISDIQRNVPENGENDPKEIWKILNDEMDNERIFHVRHNTAGATNQENCHPFPVLFIPRKGNRKMREIHFMHNGTMSEYKSKVTVNGLVKDDPDGPSDSLNYVNQVLTPMIQADYGTGSGDLQNPTLRQILTKFWPHGNRGILVSNDSPSIFFGDWKDYDNKGDKIRVSTLEHFRLHRGPEFDRRKAAEEAKKAKESPFRSGGGSRGTMFSNLRDFNFEELHGFYKLSESPLNILNDWDVYDREHAVSVGNFKREELEDLYKEKSTMISLVDWIFTDYALLYKEHMELQEDKDKATKKIASMAEEFKKLSGEKRKKVG